MCPLPLPRAEPGRVFNKGILVWEPYTITLQWKLNWPQFVWATCFVRVRARVCVCVCVCVWCGVYLQGQMNSGHSVSWYWGGKKYWMTLCVCVEKEGSPEIRKWRGAGIFILISLIFPWRAFLSIWSSFYLLVCSQVWRLTRPRRKSGPSWPKLNYEKKLALVSRNTKSHGGKVKGGSPRIKQKLLPWLKGSH